ncbi:M14 family zinc carboxypeptidase [Klenkia brasiliensis]|uniref:Zinc carboxypeptidase n=1 Tax=Klenkia brasiliensis TaxID=333142 RepID=A0A1G7T9B7_9ACTN|nr:M14 family zinc carboxypeptidase [Klenkia brasiliensis]SDG31219.1 Zinc carboxypeptidase [Klenkia brasiliensis]
MLPPLRRRTTLVGLGTALLVGLTTTSPITTATAQETVFAPQLVSIDTPTREARQLVESLGLDTAGAGPGTTDVVLHTPADLDVLGAAGLGYDVRIPDLVARSVEINQQNAAYAAATDRSPLPSGRDAYRTLDDYDTDMAALALHHRDLVKTFTLPHRSLDGRLIQGIEIGRDVNGPDTGLPVFLMMGLHHAREWPSGEMTMEFAYDLVLNYGRDQRITDLVNRSRIVIVPVVNPDGFDRSITDGALLDGRVVDDGGTVSILGTPGAAYMRKNCRVADGVDTPDGTCRLATATTPGAFGVGVDLNRNYGAYWGGPGASDQFVNPTYRGATPFSEPESQNIRELMSGRQVTTMITNHTFSDLILRPGGVSPDQVAPSQGVPIGEAADEEAMAALGAAMAAQNGYTSQRAYELYDTTGSTDDWSYNTTGGFAFTWEIGTEFHPPFPEVVDEYLGAGEYAGKGNREAYLIALENAVDPQTHSVLTGRAPAGATLRLQKSVATPTWEGAIQDTLSTTMTVGANGRYTWHVNPSTRPVVMDRQVETLSGAPVQQQSWTGTTAPLQSTDQEFVVTQDADLLEVTLDWPTPDDFDLEVHRRGADGSLTPVGSSGNSIGEKERVLLQDVTAGTYVLRVVNFASVAPSWTLDAATYQAGTTTVPGLVENWTLTCERGGQVLQRVPVVIDRGQQLRVDLTACGRR